MSYGKLITRWTTGGYDIFITCPAKSMHLEPELLHNEETKKIKFQISQVLRGRYPTLLCKLFSSIFEVI